MLLSRGARYFLAYVTRHRKGGRTAAKTRVQVGAQYCAAARQIGCARGALALAAFVGATAVAYHATVPFA